MLVDTTVFIDYSRGEKKAADFLIMSDVLLQTSIISIMEVVQGIEEKRIVSEFLKDIRDLGIEILQINETVSDIAFSIFRSYYRNGLRIEDSLITATALAYNQAIASHNVKHFALVKDLDVIKPY